MNDFNQNRKRTRSSFIIDDDDYQRPSKRIASSDSSFASLPIHLIIEVLSYYEFSFQNCLEDFSFSYPLCNQALTASSSSHQYEPLHQSDYEEKTNSHVQSKATTSTAASIDLSDPNQLLVNIMRQHQQKKKSTESASNLALFSFSNNHTTSSSSSLFLPEAPSTTSASSFRMPTFVTQEILSRSLAAQQQNQIQNVKPTDLQSMFMMNGRPLSDRIINQSSSSSSSHSLPSSACRSSVFKLLTKSLFGRFSKDRTAKIYCVFTSVNINSLNFPQKPLIKLMCLDERRSVLTHVRNFATPLVSEPHGMNPMHDIDSAISFLRESQTKLLIDCLAGISDIRGLDFSGLSLGDDGVRLLSEVQRRTNKKYKLFSVDLSRNKISDEGAKAICSIRTLRKVNLSTNDLGDAGATVLFSSPHIQSLHLSYNNITDRAVAHMLQNSSITSLDLSFNMVNEEGVRILCECKHLRKLSLKYLCLKNESLRHFSKANHLRYLDLSYNAISDEGAVLLAQNTSLQTLHLGFNSVGSIGASALFSNKNLIDLSLNNNRIYSDSLKALPLNHTLLSLDLSNNVIDDLGAILITKNSCLSYVNLANNNVTVEGARHFLLRPSMKFNLKAQFSRSLPVARAAQVRTQSTTEVRQHLNLLQ